jgi:hypothetical protein
MLFLALLTSLTVAQQQKADPDDSSKALLRHVGWYNPQSTEVVFALSMDLATAHLPGGSSLLGLAVNMKRSSSPAKDSTLEDELHRISDLKPDYQWTLDDGVLNFLPTFFAPSPLDVPITKFTVDNEITAKAYTRLFEMPDVKNGLTRLGLREPTLQIVFGAGAAPPDVGEKKSKSKEQNRITVNLENTTLRKAANAIVRADGQKTWLLSVRLCRGDNTYSTQLVN